MRFTLSFEPRLWDDPQRHLTTFTDEDVEKSDDDYEVSFPMGGSRETALPVTIVAGQTLDTGTIRLRKTAYSRAVVRWGNTACASGEMFDLALLRGGQRDSQIQAACGKDLLLRGLIRGQTYRIELSSPANATEATRRFYERDFIASDKNPELQVLPLGGAPLEGRLILAKGSGALPAKFEVGLNRQGMVKGTPVDSEGRFRFENARLGPQDLVFFQTGPLTTHIIQQLKLNGKDLPLSTPRRFEWTGEGKLEVTLDDGLPR